MSLTRLLALCACIGACTAPDPDLRTDEHAATSADVPPSDTSVTWESGPCTEPVLFVQTDKENVRGHIPDGYPQSDDEFMSHLTTTVGVDGRLEATVVFTLNRCRDNEIIQVINDVQQAPGSATNVAEVLVMVLWDGASSNAFEFYAIASYLNDSNLAGAFRSLGLPSKHVPDLIYSFNADPEQPQPGAVVPFAVEIPHTFRVSGSAVRPLTYAPGGHATHHYHGPRGEIWVEHDAPIGGESLSNATVRVTGDSGSWLADLLGASTRSATGMLLEKQVGHSHTAYLLD